MTPAKILIVLAPLVALMSSCVTTPVRVHPYSETGEPLVQKRYARHVARDFYRRFSTEAYRNAVDTDFTRFLSPDEHRILREAGRPDLVRHPFRSRLNELTTEWIYLQQQYVVQFIEGMLAYEGPVTDYERVLMEHGYPDVVTEVQVEGGGEVVHWAYRDFFSGRGKTFAFNNDTLCLELRYN